QVLATGASFLSPMHARAFEASAESELADLANLLREACPDEPSDSADLRLAAFMLIEATRFGARFGGTESMPVRVARLGMRAIGVDPGSHAGQCPVPTTCS